MSETDTLPPETSQELVTSFKNAMRRLAASVTVVTATKGQEKCRITATAVTSVTTQPPVLLICVDRSTRVHSILKKGTHFCVNLLHRQHIDVCNAFGGSFKCDDNFSYGTWDNDYSVPYLLDAQANLFCIVDGEIDYGTHTIFIGKIDAIITTGDVVPFVYQNGGHLERG